MTRVALCTTSWLITAVLVCSGCAKDPQADMIYGNGRIEGDEVQVAAKIPGRVSKLHFREGDRVEQGQLLAKLSSEEWEAELKRSRAAVKAEEASLSQVQARLDTLRHHEKTAQADYDRMSSLYETGAASAQRRDQAENELKEIQGQRKAVEAQEAQLKAQVEAARAAAEVARTNLSETRLSSPLTGLVLLRLAEEGEVMRAGAPVAVIVDPDKLFLKVYIAEKEIGKIRVGNPAAVTVDAFPDRRFEGSVSEVAQQAEFTPKDIHMPDERTQLVYAVKIRLDNPQGYLKPGMVADAEIRWKKLAAGQEP